MAHHLIGTAAVNCHTQGTTAKVWVGNDVG